MGAPVINQCQVLGFLGRDPVVRMLSDERRVATFSLGASMGGNTTWFNVSVWGSRVEVVEKWLKKGDSVFVRGFIRDKKFRDKQGVDRVTKELVVDRGGDLQMVSIKVPEVDPYSAELANFADTVDEDCEAGGES